MMKLGAKVQGLLRAVPGAKGKAAKVGATDKAMKSKDLREVASEVASEAADDVVVNDSANEVKEVKAAPSA
jgi:hypothetical protein